MALILSIETSTDVCSAAIHENANLLATAEVHIPQSHASKLSPLIKEISLSAQVKFSQLEAVAVSSGPGSYTGLRIGTSTAKAFSYALNIPLLAVNTLELMASQVQELVEPSAYLCPMLDAKRMEVYCMITDRELNAILPQDARIIDSHSFIDILANHSVIFFGNGAAKCKDVILHPNASYIDGVYPMASQLGTIAFRYWQKRQFQDVVHYEPVYLKDFIAKKAKTLF